MQRVLVALALLAASPAAFAADASLTSAEEEDFVRTLQSWEAARSDPDDAIAGASWTLRSGHFVFGMPRLVDDRHNFTPDGFSNEQAGVSVVVREGFVVAHFDQMKAPLWVAQRWTTYDFDRMQAAEDLERPWREDLDLPAYARGGISYDGNDTKLDRGHMARHETNKAWGEDVSNWGVKMSNSAPQHLSINRGRAWRDLEDKIRDVVARDGSDIEALWIYTGTIFRDKENPPGETPDEDFDNVVRLTGGGFAVPDATYKVIGWFDEGERFQARAYVFEQPHKARTQEGEQRPQFTLPDQQQPLDKFLVKIDDLEERTGIDFFPMLQDDIEQLIEGTKPNDIWGAG